MQKTIFLSILGASLLFASHWAFANGVTSSGSTMATTAWSSLLDQQIAGYVQRLKQQDSGNEAIFQSKISKIIDKVQKALTITKNPKIKGQLVQIQNILTSYLPDSKTPEFSKEISDEINTYADWVGKNISTDSITKAILQSDNKSLLFQDLSRYSMQFILNAYALSNGDTKTFQLIVNEAVKKTKLVLQWKVPDEKALDSITRYISVYAEYDEPKLKKFIADEVAWIEDFQKKMNAGHTVVVGWNEHTHYKIQIPKSLKK